MYLQTATGIDQVIEFGTKPAIELMNIIEDGDFDNEVLFVEVKGKLFEIQEALGRILNKGKAGEDPAINISF